MARTRRDTWKKHIAAWNESGLTARQFAARIGVNPNTLSHWKWRFGSEDAEAKQGTAPFIEVTAAVVAAVGSAEERIEVVCHGGLAVRVPRDFDVATLVRVIDALEGR